MSDFEVEVPEEDEQVEEVAATEDADKPASKKLPTPEGCVTPTGLTNHMNTKYGEQEDWVELKPQQMYGWHKNGKDFPRYVDEDGTEHSTNPADGRYIVPLEAGEQWVLNQIGKAKERKAKREAKLAAEAAAAEATSNDVPEVEVESAPEINV